MIRLWDEGGWLTSTLIEAADRNISQARAGTPGDPAVRNDPRPLRPIESNCSLECILVAEGGDAIGHLHTFHALVRQSQDPAQQQAGWQPRPYQLLVSHFSLQKEVQLQAAVLTFT